MDADYHITLLRHGSTEGVEKHILQGHIDFPLTSRGQAEAEALAKYWRRRRITFDLIMASPLIRAQETAKIIADAVHAPLETDEDLKERYFGAGEGVDLDKIFAWYKDKPYPTAFEPVYESGESEWDAHLRAGNWLSKLFKRPPGNYLAVSHGNIINVILQTAFGTWPQGRSKAITMPLACTGCAKLSYNTTSGRWYLETLNSLEHLSLE